MTDDVINIARWSSVDGLTEIAAPCGGALCRGTVVAFFHNKSLRL